MEVPEPMHVRQDKWRSTELCSGLGGLATE